MAPKFTNDLIKETSPYLLQHAHNPVNWHAWNPQTLEMAKEQNKLILISIGYAACHWCHVMEHECFEDEEVAKVMNQHYVNIKIDREERPDIDHIYMDALQMMTGSGGWPLNMVALPDGRPFWGATYLRKEDWTKVLKDLSDLYRSDTEKVLGYAQRMAEGIQQINIIEDQQDSFNYSIENLKEDTQNWSGYFDTFLGGYKRAPKFMMPVNMEFLLHYATSLKDETLMDYVNTTLTRMAYGGIFDHVGGGFSRYAVDTKWHVPHFEKMLYDNGLLTSLYAKAYAATKNKLYKQTVEKTIAFVTDELMSKDHAFYSSLDADSLNEKGVLEEGAYYVWKEQELRSLLKKDYKLFKEYYNINSYGHWEEGNYVLIRDTADEDFIKKHSLSQEELETLLKRCLTTLKKERNKRPKPRLDDKILTSWNGLMLKGLTDAYRYIQKEVYLDLALKNANFLIKNIFRKDGELYHNHKNGKSSINGYLEDYAAVIDAFIGLYETTFNEHWIQQASNLTSYCLSNFMDEESGLFFFTSKKDSYVIRRTLEVADNVIPSSNSIMAKNLLKLSKYYPELGYKDIYMKMLKNVQDNFSQNTQSYANWLDLVLNEQLPFYEIAIVGDDYVEKAVEINKNYLPNTVICGTKKEGNISLLKDRYIENSTQIYICSHGACQLPLTHTSKALTQLLKNSPH
ncbi:thioredoxin domain-containing protein [Maribacter sp. MMG018]|uniref:thioredoxin domain-containing protein n=1 Tax=Maribacter sp. MMG018 TaxID=2822688 RepID=UPI001B371DED|nr:thioredoxin domain-containing protein [Maribacter sp. MMG018]MBQ4914022.1 thioredoxin domain-containing protein [Maribacter sp. MMG018]